MLLGIQQQTYKDFFRDVSERYKQSYNNELVIIMIVCKHK